SRRGPMRLLLSMLILASAPRVDSKFDQISPEPPLGKLMARSAGQTRALALIPGLHLHPLSKHDVEQALFRDCQSADAHLVEGLVQHGDVYAFSYSQNVPIDDVASESELGDNIRTLRKMGYTEIVLIGHSAGGVIARQFVEDNPGCGVTR